MTGVADHVVQQNVVAIAIVGYQRRQVHLQDPWLQAENGYSHIQDHMETMINIEVVVELS